MRYYTILYLLIFAAVSIQAQDQIFRKDNTKIDATVLEVNKTEVKYKLFNYPDGPVIIVLKSELSAIIYKDGHHEVFDKEPRPAGNALFFELLGNGGVYSLNYDRIFFTVRKFSLAGRVGVSYLSQSQNHKLPYELYGTAVSTVPVQLSALYGGSNKLEVGAGYNPVFRIFNGDLYDFYNIGSVSIGYRYQKPGQGFFFKCSLMYVKSFDRYMGGSFPFTGIGWGYSF